MYGIYAIWIKNWQIRHSIGIVSQKYELFCFLEWFWKVFESVLFCKWQINNKYHVLSTRATLFRSNAISFATDLTCWWEVGAGYGAVSATSVAFLVGFENNSRAFSFDRQPVRAVLPTEPGKRKTVKCVHIEPFSTLRATIGFFTPVGYHCHSGSQELGHLKSVAFAGAWLFEET